MMPWRGQQSTGACKIHMQLERPIVQLADQRRVPAAGPVNILNTVHHVDGMDLTLAVQAVTKAQSTSSGIYLVIRSIDPMCGRPDLAEYLQDPETYQKKRMDIAGSVGQKGGDGGSNAAPQHKGSRTLEVCA